jgi:hypothetical protein
MEKCRARQRNRKKAVVKKNQKPNMNEVKFLFFSLNRAKPVMRNRFSKSRKNIVSGFVSSFETMKRI